MHGALLACCAARSARAGSPHPCADRWAFTVAEVRISVALPSCARKLFAVLLCRQSPFC